MTHVWNYCLKTVFAIILIKDSPYAYKQSDQPTDFIWFPKKVAVTERKFLEIRKTEKDYFGSNEGNTVTLVLVMVSNQNLQQWQLSTEEDHMQGYAEYSL